MDNQEGAREWRRERKGRSIMWACNSGSLETLFTHIDVRFFSTVQSGRDLNHPITLSFSLPHGGGRMLTVLTNKQAYSYVSPDSLYEKKGPWASLPGLTLRSKICRAKAQLGIQKDEWLAGWLTLVLNICIVAAHLLDSFSNHSEGFVFKKKKKLCERRKRRECSQDSLL